MTVQYRQNETDLISASSAKKDCTRLNILLNTTFKIYCYSHFDFVPKVLDEIKSRSNSGNMTVFNSKTISGFMSW